MRALNARPDPQPLEFAVVAAAYFLFARLSEIAVGPPGVAIVWLPAAVLLAAFIVHEGRGALVFAAIALLVDVAWNAAAAGAAPALTSALITVSEALLIFAALRRRRFNIAGLTIADVTLFAIAGPLVAAGAAAGARTIAHRVFTPDAAGLSDYFQSWWTADALGLMLLTPALLTIAQLAAGRVPARVRWTRWDTATVIALAGALLFTGGGGIATGPQGGPILAMPLMIALAARTSTAAVSLIAAGVGVLTATMVVTGEHPFGAGTEWANAIKAQQFMIVATVVMQGLAAMLGQIRQKRAEVEQLNADLEVRVKARTAELELALSQVRQLQGLVPICAWCKRIRDDKDFWQSVEEYIGARTDAQFSHGICPSCFAEQIKDAGAAVTSASR